MRIAALAYSLLPILPAVLADLGKAADYPNGLHPVFDPGFLQYLPQTSSKMSKWPHGTIPQACKDEANRYGKCLPTNMDVYTVTYSDCSQPWVMCRCNTAQLGINDAISLFGRMPVHMRSVVRNVVIVPDSAPNAYSINGEVVIQGDANTPSVFIHETGHHLDFQKNFSPSSTWSTAINADTCVPDSYADTNVAEDFAQNVVVELYWILRGYIPTESTPHCLHQQRIAVENNFKPDFMAFGGTCYERYPETPTVPMSGKREIAVEERTPGVGVTMRIDEPGTPESDHYYPFGKPEGVKERAVDEE